MKSKCRRYDYRGFDECGELNSTCSSVKDLLGVSQDKNSENGCLLTYPHQILRYQLRLIEPFSVKVDEWFTRYNLTSAVVYDETIDKYVGVFNDYTIRMWGHKTRDFEELVKYTFRIPVLKIVTRENKSSLIIFRNGDCVSLPYGLERCGTFGRRALFKETSAIVDVSAYTRDKTDYVCYVLKDNHQLYYIVTFPLKDNICDSSKVITVKVSNTREVKQTAVRVTGKKIVVSSATNPVVYFTWSDSCVSEYNITNKRWKHNCYRYMHDMFKEEVNMDCIGKNYFAIFIKGHHPKESRFITPHIHIAGYRSMSVKEAYTEDAKVCSVGEYVVVADGSRISVVHVTKYIIKRPTWYHNYDFNFLLCRLSQWNDFLPIFGATETFKWNQFRKYNFPKP